MAKAMKATQANANAMKAIKASASATATKATLMRRKAKAMEASKAMTQGKWWVPRGARPIDPHPVT